MGIGVLFYVMRMFGITGVYHRYFAHKAYKTSRWFQLVLAWIGAGILTLATLLLSFTIGPEALFACGDKFFLVGRGDRFARAYASLHPGHILLYTGGTTTVSNGLRDARRWVWA